MLRRTAQPPSLLRHAHLPVARGRLRQPPALAVCRRPAGWLRPVGMVLRAIAAHGSHLWSPDRVPVLRGRYDVCGAAVFDPLLVAPSGKT